MMDASVRSFQNKTKTKQKEKQNKKGGRGGGGVASKICPHISLVLFC